jgi:hypothetical protein
MADDPLQPEEAPVAQEQPDEERSGPSAWNVVGVLVLIVIIILILLLLRNCGGANPVGGGGGGDKSIVSVPKYEPLPGVVSVWVSKDTTIDKVLVGTAVRSDDVVSLGGGRYVVIVGEGQEQLTVDSLKTRPGVFDSGLVYDQDTPRR